MSDPDLSRLLTALYGLSAEVTREIFAYCPLVDVATVWLTGNFAMQRQLTRSIEKISFKDYHDLYRWPKMLCKFTKLKRLDFSAYGRLTGVVRVHEELFKLPRGLERLQLDLIELASKLQRFFDYIPTQHHGETFESWFPSLKTLLLEDRTTKDCIEPLRLPPHSKLSALSIATLHIVPPDDIDSSMPSITRLSVLSSAFTDMTEKYINPNLVSLHLRDLKQKSLFDEITKCTFLNTLRLTFALSVKLELEDLVKIPGNSLEVLNLLTRQPFPVEYLQVLPPGLTNLSVKARGLIQDDILTVNWPQSLTALDITSSFQSEDAHDRAKTTTQNVKFLSSLPKSIKKLSGMRWNRNSSLTSNKELAALPRSLISLPMTISFNSANFTLLPRTLQYINVGISITDDHLASFPPAITDIYGDLSRITSKSFGVLLSFKFLRSLRTLPVSIFKTTPAGPATGFSNSSSSLPPNAFIKTLLPLFCVNLASALPPTVAQLTLEGDEHSNALLLDFGPPNGLSTNLTYLHIYGNSKLRPKSQVQTILWNPEIRFEHLANLTTGGVYLGEDQLISLLESAPQLGRLSLSPVDVKLEDEHVKKFPRLLNEIFIMGPPTDITIDGIRCLPRSLRTVHLPYSPKALWKTAGLSPEEALSCLPKVLSIISFAKHPGQSLEAVDNCWEELLMVKRTVEMD